MNSSTSISEKGWRRLLLIYVAWLCGIGVVLLAVILALDPYDTGRFAYFPSYGVPQFGQRLAAAGLGRQRSYNVAIIGNSTLQLIDPSRISDGVDIHAISLTIPSTGPREQLAVAQYFLRHHPGFRALALIVGIDNRWCTTQDLSLTHPFPFWLYEDNMANYVIGMMQYQTLESAGRKIKLLRGKAEPLPVDGYNDYDAGKTWSHAEFSQLLDAPNEETVNEPITPPPYTFTSISDLNEFLSRVPRMTKVVLVMPPQYKKDMVGYAGDKQHACEENFKAITQKFPNAVFINFPEREELTSRDEDYWDHEHYRARVARVMENEIAKKLR